MTTIERKIDEAGHFQPARALQKAYQTVGSSFVVGLVLIAAVIFLAYFRTVSHLVQRWSSEPDYSHGFLVPLVSVWLLWQRRGLIPAMSEPVRGRWLGLALLVASGALHLYASSFEFFLLGAVALVICMAGVPALIGGFSALRWAWPAVVFLLFMVPLPGALASRLSGPLQHIATLCSAYTLQTLGIPAIAAGNVIWLSHGKIGVVEACNGLRMLMMFGAVTMAAVFFLNLASWEKLWLLISAAGIAIVANVFRITATGVAYELLGAHVADKIFHDLAGWIMMPLAMLMLGLEVQLLSKLFPTVPERPPVLAHQIGRTTKPRRGR